MWIATPTATRLGLGNEFFDRRPSHITPPGAAFLKNSEQLYGLWFFAINTLIEAYMKDALTFAASMDSAIMQMPPGRPPSPLRSQSTGGAASATSARKWARAWLRSHKGPAKWIQGFEQLGVSGFTQHLDDRLYELLGVRHLVVHSAGVVDEEYLRHHPTSPWAVGAEASIDEGMLHGFVQTTFEFFAPIEAHLVNRFIRAKP